MSGSGQSAASAGVRTMGGALGFEPLLNPGDLKAPPPRAGNGKNALARLEDKIKTRFNNWWQQPRNRKRGKLVAAIAIPLILIGGGAAYWQWGLVHQPDYENDGLDMVLDFTLLTDDFNKLPVKERLALIQQLVDRMKNMQGGDSAMMAAFAAGIAGKAREQLMENGSKLAIDMFDQYAAGYKDVPEREREKYIEDSLIDIIETVESLGRGGVPRDVPREERLAEMKRNAQRDQDRMSRGSAAQAGEMTARVFGFMQQNVGVNATPVERARGTLMMRDMTRYLRGQDLTTGRDVPKSQPTTPPARSGDNGPR
jgi:hypothetical protein